MTDSPTRSVEYCMSDGSEGGLRGSLGGRWDHVIVLRMGVLTFLAQKLLPVRIDNKVSQA